MVLFNPDHGNTGNNGFHVQIYIQHKQGYIIVRYHFDAYGHLDGEYELPVVWNGYDSMRIYMDMPFVELGDEPCTIAPIQEVVALAYDGEKYVTIRLNNIIPLLYQSSGRISRVLNVPCDILETPTRWYEPDKESIE